MRLADDRFTLASRPIGNGHRRVQVATCGACGHVGEVTDGAPRTAMPPEAVKKKFVQRGWFIGKSATHDRCPKCNTVREKPAPKPKEVTMSDASTQAVRDAEKAAKPTPAAEPPREPTREDRRRVLDALDEHYLVDAQCYSKSFTDEAVAKKIGLPRAWVARLREDVYGPEENEDSRNRAAATKVQLDALEHRAKTLEDKGMQLASEAETLRKVVEKMRATLA